MDRTVFSRFSKIALAVLACAQLSCGGPNYFKDAAVKDSDEALYEDALKLIDAADYTGAIEKINQTSATFRTGRKVVRSLAGAYAGRCGLDFMAFTQGLGGSGAPFNLFKNGFTSSTVVPADCQTAQEVIEGAFGATAAERIANLGTSEGNSVNMFMAVLGMSKIGSTLREAADADQDGTVDGGYDSCDSSKLSDDATKQVGTGFALMIDNFTVIASSFDESTATLVDGISDVCDDITPNPCAIFDPEDPTWDATALLAMRSLTRSNSFGIENCDSGDAPSNPAPYPFSCCAP